jgi:predicted lipoprotein with Yx(FWY)xxD motif
MRTKYIWIIIIAVIIVAAIVGGLALFNKPSNTTTSTTNSSVGTNSQNQVTSVNNAVVITKTSSNVGSYLADPAGNTLYTDGSGSAGVTNCMGSCLTAWPPYQDKAPTTGLPANISTVKRSDNGEVQYTYKGMALYYFSSDTGGQVTGNGVSGFYAAKP